MNPNSVIASPTLAAAHAAKIARRRKWEVAARRLVKAMEPPPPPRIWTEQHDSHVWARRRYLEGLHESPKVFLKRRCLELGVEMSDILGPSRAKEIVEIRHMLITEVRGRFPKDGHAKLARLFRRDHSTILHVLSKLGGDTSARHRHAELDRAEIVRLYAEGIQQKEVAERVGCAASAVSRVLSMEFPNRPKRKMIDDYAARIEALFDEGATYAEIGHRFGFDPSAISKFVKRQGWTR